MPLRFLLAASVALLFACQAPAPRGEAPAAPAGAATPADAPQPLQKVTVAYVAPVETFFASLPVPREEAIQAVLDREAELDVRAFKPSDFVDVSFLREIEESGFLRQFGAR